MTVKVVAAHMEVDLSADDGETRLLYAGERRIREPPGPCFGLPCRIKMPK